MNKILILISVFFIFSHNAFSKEYKYQQFLKDNDLTPVIESDLDNSVDIIEFSSFSCSHCASFHNETFSDLKTSEVFKNVNYYVVDFPLNQAAFYASIIASCDLSIRPNYINSVYGNYDVWTKAETGEDIIELLNSYGLQLGLGEDQLEACLKDEELQNKLLKRQVDSQNIFGVESTPTFIVGGEKVQGNRPASEFIKIISKKLNQ